MAACSLYKFAGLQNGYQCFCGNVQPNPSLLRPGQCTMSCPGNSNENCGGSWRMNVYENIGKSGSSAAQCLFYIPILPHL